MLKMRARNPVGTKRLRLILTANASETSSTPATGARSTFLRTPTIIIYVRLNYLNWRVDDLAARN